MTDEIKDGGPAFPHHVEDWSGKGQDTMTYSGMSLRDWFTGQALMGFAASMHQGNLVDLGFGQINGDLWARAALALADATLKARQP